MKRFLSSVMIPLSFFFSGIWDNLSYIWSVVYENGNIKESSGVIQSPVNCPDRGLVQQGAETNGLPPPAFFGFLSSPPMSFSFLFPAG